MKWTYLREVKIDLVSIKIGIKGLTVGVVHADGPLALPMPEPDVRTRDRKRSALQLMLPSC